MGMSRTVELRNGLPSWPAVAAWLAAQNCPVSMRMIDGQLAFPDEAPPDSWTELRIGTAAGMISIRREGPGVTLIIWENADESLKQAWNLVAEAYRSLDAG